MHFGSLVTAVGSFLDARAHGGQWLLRMEDLDPPRESPGAADAILRSLDAFGLHWDGALLYQHSRLDAYQAVVERLRHAGLAFPCACSRTEIADSSLLGVEGPVYPGTCRHGLPPGKPARAIRLRVADGEILSFDDAIQGQVRQHLAKEVGDFVICRADGCFTYQLAVVLDDAFQGITHVVRGADLLLSTPRQLYLQRLLHLPTLIYMHLPVAVTAAGEKLSKQTHAAAVNDACAPALLFQALEFLRQEPPPELRRSTVAELLHWGVGHWRPLRVESLHTQKITLE